MVNSMILRIDLPLKFNHTAGRVI